MPLHHVVCGGTTNYIRNCDLTDIPGSADRVIRHMIRQRWRCRRCKQILTDYNGIVPLWNPAEEGVFPITRRDESGQVGFGPEYRDPALDP